MKLIIGLNVELLTESPVMDTESRKQRIQQVQQLIKPVADIVGRRLSELGINKFICTQNLPYISISQDVSDSQLKTIKSWEEVKSVTNGDTPIHLIW